jgi:hypothetical protein
MSNRENDVAVGFKAKKSNRILTFDLLRGFFLLIIMIDHVELYPNGWDFITGKGRLWVSAAEGFFFMSGLLIGMVYKRRLHLGMKYIFKKMWLRAAELYLVGVGLTFLYLAWAIYSGHGGIKDMPWPFDWGHYSGQALLMRYTFGWADFLVRFALLMLIAPFVFFLVAKGKWWLALAGIVTAWALRGQGFTLAWQLIFNLGILIGYYWYELEKWYASSVKPKQKMIIKTSFAAVAATTFLASYASVYVLSLLNHLWIDNHLPIWLQHVTWTWNRLNYDIWVYADKWTMGALRVFLFFMWFPVLYWLVRRHEAKLNRLTGGVVELLGRNSLFVYTAHSLIVFVFKLYLIPSQTNFIQNFLITGLGLVLLIVLTMLYKKISETYHNKSIHNQPARVVNGGGKA